MAEVLITLGIIGVVAALTIAPLVHKYKIHQLEVAFKRSSSLVEQAILKTSQEFGFNNFNELNKMCLAEGNSCRNWTNQNKDFITDINNNFISNFKVVRSVKPDEYSKLELNKVKITTYSGVKAKASYDQLYGITTYVTPDAGLYFLNDGSTISGITFFYHNFNDGVSFTFDTNGPYKGPNRYGYDIFLFTTGSWNPLCTGTYNNIDLYNGRGCYQWALKNQNPDDETKGYWESL